MGLAYLLALLFLAAWFSYTVYLIGLFFYYVAAMLYVLTAQAWQGCWL
jgi:hypothetical protein